MAIFGGPVPNQNKPGSDHPYWIHTVTDFISLGSSLRSLPSVLLGLQSYSFKLQDFVLLFVITACM